MQIWSHRGRVDVARPAADNTREAVALAFSYGASGVEIDTWRTADFQFVVGHDRESPAGLVDALARAAVPCRADLGDVVDVAPLAGTINVELKVAPDASLSEAASLGESLAAYMTGRARSGVVVSSFSRPATDAVLAVAPELSVALLCHEVPSPDHLRALAEAGYWGVHPEAPLLERAGVEAIHAAGLVAVVWTLNDAERAAYLAGVGVDAVITDVPIALRERLRGEPPWQA